MRRRAKPRQRTVQQLELRIRILEWQLREKSRPRVELKALTEAQIKRVETAIYGLKAVNAIAERLETAMRDAQRDILQAGREIALEMSRSKARRIQYGVPKEEGS